MRLRIISLWKMFLVPSEIQYSVENDVVRIASDDIVLAVVKPTIISCQENNLLF